VVQRKNRSLYEMARTMLDEHRTPQRYWAEAVNTALGLLFVGALFSRRVGFISLSRGLPMGSFWVMRVILEHSVCSTFILT
jgi:hypothetical protein